MFKKTITCENFNGVVTTEDYYFNLTESEIIEMQLGTAGGLDQQISHIVAGMDMPNIVKFFKDFVLRSYGVKSPDGKRFIKNDEIREAFSQTNAYNKLFMELAFDDKAASDFINGVIPKDVSDNMAKVTNGNVTSIPATPNA